MTKKTWAVGVALAAMLSLSSCVVEVYEPPNPDPSRGENLTIMKTAWDEMDPETQAGLCAGWMEDKEAALDLMRDETFPPRETVREFFDRQCFN